jgi:hypothetical protein
MNLFWSKIYSCGRHPESLGNGQHEYSCTERHVISKKAGII